MKKTATEINREYKIQKKLERERQKMNERIEKYRKNMDKKRKEEIEKAKKRIDEKFKRTLARWEKLRLKTYERNKRKIQGKKPLKKNAKKVRSIASLKKSVFQHFQRCVRWDAQDNNGYVVPIDKPFEMRKRNVGIDAGHYYPKHNYPHMIFYRDNVRPQTKQGNRMQLDGIGDYKDEIHRRIGNERFKKLEELAKDKKAKNTAIKEQQDRRYWEWLEKYWKEEKKKRINKTLYK